MAKYLPFKNHGFIQPAGSEDPGRQLRFESTEVCIGGVSMCVCMCVYVSMCVRVCVCVLFSTLSKTFAPKYATAHMTV